MTDQFNARVSTLLTAAVGGLDPADVAERLAHCQATGEHGIRMHPSADDDVVEFRWGGRRLALVAAAALASGEPLAAGFVAEDTPDTVPEEWGGQ